MNHFVVQLSTEQATDTGRFGPKAANLAALGQAGLPIPDGFCLDVEAYRRQVTALALEASARGVFASDDRAEARKHALRMRQTRLRRKGSSSGKMRVCEIGGA